MSNDMTTTLINLSNETFWKWLKDRVILGNIDYFDNMIDIERYVTGHDFKKNQSQKTPIFYNLKDAIPSDYFLEMEYCALAYAVIFDKVFPPLSQHIEQLAYIEWLHYVEPERPGYRDHFVHVLKVAFVCDEIFRRILSKNIVDWQFASSRDGHFKAWCKKEKICFNKKKTEKIIHAAIFLSAIFHDIGYGYQFVRDYEKKLFKLNLLGCDSIDITKNRGDVLKRSLLASFIIEYHEWGKNKELEFLQEENLVLGFFRDCLPLNHSVASALTVLDIAEDLYRSHIIDSELYIAFQIAAEACCFHDMTALKKYLHLENSGSCNHFLDCRIYESIPVAILLILADELSMWSRPRVEYAPGENGREKTTRLHHRWQGDQVYPDKIDLEFSAKELNIKLDSSEQNKIFKKELLNLPVLGDAINTDCLSVFNYVVHC
jgi:hypothetical protein